MSVLTDVYFKYIHFRMRGDTEFNPQRYPLKILTNGKMLSVFSCLLNINRLVFYQYFFIVSVSQKLQDFHWKEAKLTIPPV